MTLCRFRLVLAICAATLVLHACDGGWGDNAPRIALLGGSLRIADPAAETLDDTDHLLLSTLGQGLVSFDPDGNIEQGLAAAWTVTDDGMSYIFRLAPATWDDGSPVTSKDVAAILTARIAPSSNIRLLRETLAIETIRAMTDNVIEIRLFQPQSDLLELLAQPEFAIATKGQGWGPMRARLENGRWLMAQAPDPLLDRVADADGEDPETLIEAGITGPARALARYRMGEIDAVLGGRYQDYPYVLGSGIDISQLVIDPAHGLFGLAFVNDSGFFAAAQNRAALAKAIDRQAIIDAFGIETWSPQVTIRPAYAGTSAVITPAIPLWSDSTLAGRRESARRTIAEWRNAGGAMPDIRISMPQGAGSRILFASIKADLAAIGLNARRVLPNASADLRLIDEVAPSNNPLWIAHRLSCAQDILCDARIDAKVIEADAAETIDERNILLGQIDAELTALTPYIPLATPLRWALVKPGVRGYRANIRARHGLDHLAATNR